MRTQLILLIFLFLLFPIYSQDCSVSIRDDSQNEVYKLHAVSSLFIDSTIQRVLSYRESYTNFILPNIVFYALDFMIYVFDDINCLKIQQIENVAYLSTSIDDIITSNKQSFPNIIPAFVVYYRTSQLTPQSFLYFYDSHTRQRIPATSLQNTKIDVITTSTINIQQFAYFKELYDFNMKHNVNVFHSNETIFNEFCLEYYDTNITKDVVLSDRRNIIYVPLCDEGFSLEEIVWMNNNSSVQIKCKTSLMNMMTCPIRESMVNETANMFFEKDVSKESGLKAFKCGDMAFEGKRVKKNFAFWLILIFIIGQIVIVIIYFWCYFDKYNEYLDFLESKVDIIEEDKNEIDNNNDERKQTKRKSHISKTYKNENIDEEYNNNNNVIIDDDNNNNNLQYHRLYQNSTRNFQPNTPHIQNNNDIDLIEQNDNDDNNNIDENDNNINTKFDKELHLTPFPNPPKPTNLIIESKTTNTNNTNNNTLNIETSSKPVNTETVIPILRSSNSRKSKKQSTSKRKTFKTNDNIDSNTNITRNNSHSKTFSRSSSKHRSSNKRSTLRRTTKQQPTRSFRRNSTRRTSTVILDSNFNEKEFDPHELIILPLEKAVIHDKRSVITVYLSTICDKVFVVNICNYGDVSEPFLLRLFAFLFAITCLIFFSGVFFNETYISNRFRSAYTKTAKVNYAYIWKEETPKSIYAGLLSMVLIIIMNYFLQTRTELTKLNKIRKEGNFEKEKSLTLNKIKLKHIIVFIVNFIFMILFWYFCVCFCSLYPKTQLALIETAFNATIFCVIFTLFLYLIFCIMRVYSMECKSNCLYCFSSFFL